MKRKLNKYYVWYCILAVMIFLCGCGNSNRAVSSQTGSNIRQEDVTYITQYISLPEYDFFDAAYADGNDLYYAAGNFNQASQQYETAFYTLRQGAAEPEITFALEENQKVQCMTMDEAGNIYYIGYEETAQEEAGSRIVPDFMLYKLDTKGTLLLRVDLTEYTKGQEQTVIQDIAVDEEKRIVLTTQNQNIFALNPEGGQLFTDRTAGRIYDICNSNGNIFIGYDSGNGIAIKKVDIAGKKLLTEVEYNISGNRFYMVAGGNGDLLIATEESVYQYTSEKEEIIKKLDWQAYDFTGISAGILLPYEEKGVLAISRNYATDPMQIEAVTFCEAVDGESFAQEKTVLTLGIPFAPPAGINAEIVNFNKTNPDYKIEVVNYNEDYIRFNTDVMAGNGPDLLVMRSHSTNQFSKKGVLEDLNPYFDQDETLNRSDFLENVLTAYETDGQLYWMPMDFDIYTMAAKTSVLGEKSGWNMDELTAFTQGFPEGTAVFENISKSGILRLLKYAYSNQLVDMDHAESPLNRELLMKMLTFANQYVDDEKYIEYTNLSGRVEEEQVILLDVELYAGQAAFACASLFGEPVTFIGFPAEEKNGHLLYSLCTFAISSSSEHKDIAWKFISTLLSEEAQMRMEKDYSTKGFHIRKDALEAHFEWAMENYDVYSFYNISGGAFSYRDIPGKMTKEDLAPIRKLIQNADTMLTISPDIDQLIEEEAIFYFNGTKPIEEVVDVIENRVRTYVSEMK